MSDLNLSIPISKIDEEQRIIGGWATVEELDKQGEITDYQASKKAFSNWEGNIREMHDPTRAIGKKVSVAFDDENKAVFVSAKISESTDGQNAWTKIKEGILTGFSIGGRVVKLSKDTVKDATGTRDVNRIMEYELSELSVVDNPAVPSAMLTVVKSMGGKLYEAEVLQRANDPKATEWWQKYYAIEPNQIIEKSNSLDNINMVKHNLSNKQKSLLTKSVCDADMLTDLAQGLVYYIGKEEAEGEDMSGVRQALQLIQQEIAMEVMEGDDFDEETQEAIYLAATIKDLRKDTNMAKNEVKTLEKDMYGKRPTNDSAQSAVNPSAQTNQVGEANGAPAGGGNGTEPMPQMSPSVGDQSNVGQQMYDVRSRDGDTSVDAIAPSSNARLETETGAAFQDHSDEGELENVLSLLHSILSRRGTNIEQATRPRVISGGTPSIVQSTTPTFTKSTDSISKASSDQFGKVERILSSLVDRIERLEVQPATSKAYKGEYAVVEKSVEVEAPLSELDSLLKQADAAANNPDLDLNARSALALKIRKAQRAQQ